MIAGQPWRGSTSIRCNSAAPGVRGHGAADAADALVRASSSRSRRGGRSRRRWRSTTRSPPVSLVPGTKRRRRRRGRRSTRRTRPPPLTRRRRRSSGSRRSVGLVDAVGVVVVPAAGGEGEGEHGYGHERDVAGAATAFGHSASSLFGVDLAQGGDDLGVRDLGAQLLELVGHDEHHVLDVVVELGRLVGSWTRASRISSASRPVRIATAPMPPAITNAPSQRPRKLWASSRRSRRS